jgi:hypothetical protein
MTEAQNNRRIDSKTVIPLGLAGALFVSAVGLAYRLPSEDRMRAIVNEGNRTLEERLRVVEQQLAVIKDRLDRNTPEGR